jgi:hypothetical protein
VPRFLEDDLWQAVKTSIDAMPRDTAREQEHYARVCWLISLLYLMGLRISEVVSNPMGGFFRRRDRDRSRTATQLVARRQNAFPETISQPQAMTKRNRRTHSAR